MTTTPWPPTFETVLRTHLPLLDKSAPITPEMSLVDSGLDSLATVSLLIELEDRFSVSVPDELLTATSFANPGSIWEIFAKLIPEGTT